MAHTGTAHGGALSECAAALGLHTMRSLTTHRITILFRTHSSRPTSAGARHVHCVSGVAESEPTADGETDVARPHDKEPKARIHERLWYLWQDEPGIRGFFGTVDHKKLGKRYIATAFFFLVLGGLLALLMRLQLAAPQSRVLGPEAYNQVFTMHGTVMIFWYAQPI